MNNGTQGILAVGRREGNWIVADKFVRLFTGFNISAHKQVQISRLALPVPRSRHPLCFAESLMEARGDDSQGYSPTGGTVPSAEIERKNGMSQRVFKALERGFGAFNCSNELVVMQVEAIGQHH
ncbi:hypothetical protein CFAL_01920 [Corynebacterium falsenii DSM 44353]|nr:hypothetical protein CFAL_01920 [Corynebacterium falsenii DSM 44353]